jgi:hypothetical protein
VKKGAVYLHKKTVYTFQGEAIPAPAPGTYDATKWTPPTHRMYAVVIQDDGIWAIEWGASILQRARERRLRSQKQPGL